MKMPNITGQDWLIRRIRPKGVSVQSWHSVEIHDGAENGPACHFSFCPGLVFHQRHGALSSDVNALLSVSS